MVDKKSVYNPWTPEDEKEHPSSSLEWWCIEAFFTTIENNKKWSFKADLTEWAPKSNKIGSLYKFALLDQNNKENYVCDIRDDTARLKSSKNSFDVKFNESYFKGAFPNYEMHLKDQKDNIEIFLKYNAKSYPHWISQDTTNGWLPLGFGFYRYGFIPKGKVSGTLKIKNKEFKITGEGYYEHVWGEFTYHKLIGDLKGLKKSISTYVKLIGHWMRSNKIKIPKTLKFATENNPLGYDWAWALLDNGWTVFYGNIMFWLMEGPVTGVLILSKDGKTYEELYNVNFKYNKTRQAKDYDFEYPTEMEINAMKGKEKLHIKFKMTSETREYVSQFTDSKYWLGLAICEASGTLEGYYDDGKKKTKLSGICKIEPQRQIAITGHNSLKIDFLKPPKGFGLSLDLCSHILKREIFARVQLIPKPKFNFNIKKLNIKKP